MTHRNAADQAPPPNTDPLYSPDEAADYLGITRKLLDRLRSDGKLPTIVFGHRTVRIRRSALDAFLDGQEAQQ